MRVAAVRAAVCLAVAGLGLTPSAALAHAAFVSSRPAPGERLGGAPGVVVLRFTEPLIPSLSRAVVTDPSGGRFEGGAAGEREIRVRLLTNEPGVYRVEWKTVSPIDGHALRGRFSFGVGASPAEREAATAFSPRAADLVVAAFRTLEYLGLLAAAGMLLLARLARRAPPVDWARFLPGRPLALALASGLAVVVGEAVAAAQPGASAGALAAYLASPPGLARLARVGAEGVALAAARSGRRLVALPVAVAVGAAAAAGHAAAVRPALWGIGVDAVHLGSAGLWAGALLALAGVRPPGGWRGPEARRLLDRFSPVAVAAFLVTVATGILRGVQELGGLGDLALSSYGRVLGFKVLAVIAMVPLSIAAWRRLSGSPRREAELVVLVVGLASVLAAYPLPPARLAESEAARQEAARGAEFPRDGDVTLGGDAGQVLVGLTLRPGRPGRNAVFVYLLPLEGEEEAAGLEVRLAAGGRSLAMEECGTTCRTAALDLATGERVEVRIEGGTARFEVPELPAPDGAPLLEVMRTRMGRLRAYRIEEVLRPADPPIRTLYSFASPDRMRIESSTGFEVVSIGTTQFRRERGAASWEVSENAPAIRVPFFIWDTFPPSAARLLTRAAVEGIDTQVVSFFAGESSTPIWFRLWVDSEGLVRKAEMRAQGHFMDHRYYDFDEPLAIERPVS